MAYHLDAGPKNLLKHFLTSHLTFNRFLDKHSLDLRKNYGKNCRFGSLEALSTYIGFHKIPLNLSL